MRTAAKVGGTILLMPIGIALAMGVSGARAQEVTYGPNETAKSLSLSRQQLGAPVSITARSEPVGRVCDVPDGAQAVRSFVAAIAALPAPQQQQQARVRVRALKGFGMTDAGENQTTSAISDELWSALGFPGNRRPPWWNANEPRTVTVSAESLAALNGGQSASVQVYSRCLDVPSFRAWLAEVVRVLEQYYQITN